MILLSGSLLDLSAGGRGGRGNLAFKSQRNNAPKMAEKGEAPGDRWLMVELRLVADVGFVGVPNAGKSTLLAASSNAKPKIANYQFTTVVPNLGVCDLLENQGLVLADIPGLLEGAHTGVGMGIAFLRHVARCRVLIHVINGDSPDPLGDFNVSRISAQMMPACAEDVLFLSSLPCVTRNLTYPPIAFYTPKLRSGHQPGTGALQPDPGR